MARAAEATQPAIPSAFSPDEILRRWLSAPGAQRRAEIYYTRGVVTGRPGMCVDLYEHESIREDASGFGLTLDEAIADAMNDLMRIAG